MRTRSRPPSATFHTIVCEIGTAAMLVAGRRVAQAEGTNARRAPRPAARKKRIKDMRVRFGKKTRCNEAVIRLAARPLTPKRFIVACVTGTCSDLRPRRPPAGLSERPLHAQHGRQRAQQDAEILPHRPAADVAGLEADDVLETAYGVPAADLPRPGDPGQYLESHEMVLLVDRQSTRLKP